MNDLYEQARAAAAKQASQDVIFVDIFTEHFELNNPEKSKEPGYMAYGTMAVDVAVRIANMFMCLKANTGVARVMADMTYNLNVNEFWQKNASVLVPLMHVALNAHNDAAALLLDRVTNNDYQQNDSIIGAARAMPLEIFPMIAFLVGGPQLMRRVSLPLKQALAPHLLS